jgi:acetyltransferase-like isoleucine patch superfamily enzyme
MSTIHPTALVASPRVGEGTRIWAWVNVLPGATIGRDCNICDRCFIENDVVIGDRVTVKCGVSLYDGLALEDDVFVGPGVIFSNDPRPRSGRRRDAYPRTLVRTGASLGAAAVLLPGITVGRWAMVGAGSLLTRDVPDFALSYGSPARVHGYVCRCGDSLRFNDRRARCPCGRGYEIEPDGGIAETVVP